MSSRFVRFAMLMTFWTSLVAIVMWTFHYIETHRMDFTELKVVHNGTYRLKITRKIGKTSIGGFYVSVFNNSRSCSYAKPHDMIESTKTSFETSFQTRMRDCWKRLGKGVFHVVVTYDIRGVKYTRETKFIKKK